MTVVAIWTIPEFVLTMLVSSVCSVAELGWLVNERACGCFCDDLDDLYISYRTGIVDVSPALVTAGGDDCVPSGNWYG